LPFLNNEDLDQIGVKLAGHRKKLLIAAAALRGIAPPTKDDEKSTDGESVSTDSEVHFVIFHF